MLQWDIPQNWGLVRLGDVAPEVSSQILPKNEPDRTFNYWSLDAISQGQIDEPGPNYVLGSTISSTCVSFTPNHVLYAKLRPYLNKVIVPSVEGIGSTEWVVLAPDPSVLDRKYLGYALRTTKFVQHMTESSAGARMPRARKDVLFDSVIPVPFPDNPARSLETQRRIVLRLESLLAEVKSARELQETIEDDTGQLMQSLLGEIFSSENGWGIFSISQFADVKGGKRLPKGEKFAEGQTDYPYLRVVDFKSFSIDKENLKYLTPEIHQRIRSYTISKDDVYISIAGTIGLVGTIPPELDGSNLTENAAKIVFHREYKEKIEPKFLAYYLASQPGSEQIKKYTMAAGQPKLALMRIKEIKVPLPDVNIQRSIISRIDAIREEISEMQRAQSENAELLAQTEQSFLAQAFCGEL
jgi:type I restriction enzyme S subunit